ncbi:MAG: hypothetical protein AB2A00_28960 [Myxococcota bacterium]
MPPITRLPGGTSPSPTAEGRTAPGLPNTTTVSRPGAAPDVTTGVRQPTEPAGDPVADVMERGRRPTGPEIPVPAVNRTFTLGTRALDVRLDPTGAMVRGTVPGAPGTTTTAAAGVDSNAAAVAVGRTTDVQDGRNSFVRNSVLNVRLDANGLVSGNAGTAGRAVTVDERGTTRTTGHTVEVRTDGTTVGATVGGTVERRTAEGEEDLHDGVLEGTLTPDGGAVNGRGRIYRSSVSGTLDANGELHVTTDRTGVRGTASTTVDRTRGNVRTRDEVTVNVAVDGNGPQGAGTLRRTTVLSRGTEVVTTTHGVTGRAGTGVVEGEFNTLRAVEDAAAGRRREVAGSLRAGLGQDGPEVHARGRLANTGMVNGRTRDTSVEAHVDVVGGAVDATLNGVVSDGAATMNAWNVTADLNGHVGPDGTRGNATVGGTRRTTDEPNNFHRVTSVTARAEVDPQTGAARLEVLDEGKRGTGADLHTWRFNGVGTVRGDGIEASVVGACSVGEAGTSGWNGSIDALLSNTHGVTTGRVTASGSVRTVNTDTNFRNELSGSVVSEISANTSVINVTATDEGSHGTGADRLGWRAHGNTELRDSGFTAGLSVSGTVGDESTGGYGAGIDAVLTNDNGTTAGRVTVGADHRSVGLDVVTNTHVEATTTGNLPSVTLERSVENLGSGLSSVVSGTVDADAGTARLTVGSRDASSDVVVDRTVTVEVNAPTRGGSVSVGTSVTADGVTHETHTRVEASVPPEGSVTTALGREVVHRSDEGVARRGGRVEWTGVGVRFEAGHEDANNPRNGTARLAARGEIAHSHLDVRVDRFRGQPDGTSKGLTAHGVVNTEGVSGSYGTARTDATGTTEHSVVMGAGQGMVRVGGAFNHTRPDGTANGLDGRVGFGDRRLDAILTSTREWDGKLGRLAVSVAGHVHVSNEVEDLGAVSDVPALAGKHRVVIKGTRSVDGAASVGLRVGIVAAGISGRGGRGQEVTYVTHLDAPEAAQLGDGSRKSALVEAIRPKLDLSRPLSLRPHDELTVRTHGDVALSADLSVAGVGLAGRVTLRGEFAFSVQRGEGSKVRIQVTPSKVQAVAVEGRALVAVVGLEGARAQALTQSYEIDLDTPAGKQAYAAAMEGRLPVNDVAEALQDTAASLDVVDRVNAKLPHGVRALQLGMEKSKQTTRSVGFSWALWNRGKSEHNTVTDKRVAESGRLSTARTLAHDVTARTWLSGNEAKGVFATVDQVTELQNGRPVTGFRQLTLGARFSDDKVKGAELNDEVISVLSTAVGLNLRDTRVDGGGHKRTVEATLRLGENELRLLASPSVDLRAAARKAGADEGAVDALVRELRRSPVPANQAMAVQDFVSKGGLAALGVVVRALPGTPLDIQTSNSVYQDAETAVEAALANHGGPPSPDVDEEAFSKRFKEVQEAREKTNLAITHADDDPLLQDNVRTALHDKLVTLKDRLNPLLDVSAWTHDQRRKLYNELDWGWTTDADYGAMDVLKNAGIA